MAAAADTGWQPRESRDEQAERICQSRFPAQAPQDFSRRGRRAGFDALGAANSRPGECADPDRQPQLVHRRPGLCRRKQFQRHEPLLRQHQLDRRRPQDRDHQGRRSVQSAGRPAKGQETRRERQRRSGARHPGEQRRARGAQLHEAAKGVLCGVRRRHRRHHLGPLSLSVPHLDLDLSALHADGELHLRQPRQSRSSPRRPTMPAAAMSWRSSSGPTSPGAARCSRKSGRRSTPRITARI